MRAIYRQAVTEYTTYPVEQALFESHVTIPSQPRLPIRTWYAIHARAA